MREALDRMEARLKADMASAAKPYDHLVAAQCLLIMTVFGVSSAMLYPVLIAGLIALRFMSESNQLYAPPVVVLTVLGTVYGTTMGILYVMHTRHNLAVLVAHVKYTATPIVCIACLMHSAGPRALFCATVIVGSAKVWRAALLHYCWSGSFNVQTGSQMRVMISADSIPPKLDGVQIFIRNTMHALIREGHKVHVFCSNGDPDTPLAPETFGATVTRGPGLEVKKTHKITLPSIHYFFALLQFRPHIVHLFDLTPSAFFLVPLNWWLGIPTVISHHSRIDLYASYVPGVIGDYASRVVRAVQEVVFPLASGHLLIDGSQKGQSWFSGHPNCRVWSTGCDLQLFHPSKADARVRNYYSNGRPDLPLVVFVGRLSVEKQVEKLVELVQLTNPPDQPEVCRFAIVGDGESFARIKAAVGHRPDVNMPGVVRGVDLAALFASADVFFSPTVTGTLDLVFIESQAAGIAVVGPRCAAVPLVVADGVTGNLYDPLDMVDARRAILETIPQLDRMKIEARRNAEANFTWFKVTGEAIDFYRDTLRQFCLSGQ
eukprot:TRINITY_DN8705_c0_g1_i2.p1 TRINITY_DN8705_c0_g1~~TRINITY_DN8705_c0_g1_i2.p1  ORF type:complete len:546 (+),score=61.96 TRINITY_DN8705_c0_g1_i2:56-1693(+)